MSEKYPTEHERRQILSDCPTCKAKAGGWCTTRRGVLSTFLHVPRGRA